MEKIERKGTAPTQKSSTESNQKTSATNEEETKNASQTLANDEDLSLEKLLKTSVS